MHFMQRDMDRASRVSFPFYERPSYRATSVGPPSKRPADLSKREGKGIEDSNNTTGESRWAEVPGSGPLAAGECSAGLYLGDWHATRLVERIGSET